MDNNNSNEIIKENDSDWGEDLEVQEVNNNNSYIRLFESLIKANDFAEPNLMISNIILKKQQLNLVLTKFNELLNQSQISMDRGTFDIFETTVLSENGIAEESHRLL